MATSDNTGRFITLEGAEGVGKTTNIQFIKSLLEQYGKQVVLTREPGGTALSEAIRTLLLDKKYTGMHRQTELLLIFAARAEHIHQIIKPALARGHWVISDRFIDASYAYQGSGREFGFPAIAEIETLVLNGFRADLTLLLDAPVELGMKRVAERGQADRFESEQLAFFERVRDGYLQRAEQQPHIHRIDATQSLASVQAAIRNEILPLLETA